MRDWGMNAGPLHRVGGSVSDLSVDAQAAGKGFLDSVTDAGGSVHHPVVKGSLERFRAQWTTPANRLWANIDAAGSQLRGVANTGSGADGDATTVLAAAGQSTSEHTSSVMRPINT